MESRPWLLPVPALRHSFRVSDPEDFGASAPRGVQHRMLLRSRGPFEAWRWRSASPMMVASRGRTRLAVTHRTGTGGLAFFTFVADGDPPSVMHGRTLTPGTLAWCRAHAEIHSQSPAGATWSNLCFPVEMVAQDWAALYGPSLGATPDSVEVVPVDGRLQRRIEAGIDASLAASEHAPTLVHGLLRLVLEAFARRRRLLQAMESPAAWQETPRGLARHVRTADGLVAVGDRIDATYPLAAVCAQLGVSLRALNASSNAVLGMGAGQYLRRRRLHRVHTALREGAVSVTDAAMEQGFYDLGRFAVDYRGLFGASPSTTLRASAARSKARDER